jgi:hypothetical protein
MVGMAVLHLNEARSSVLTQMMNSMCILPAFGEQSNRSALSIDLSIECAIHTSSRTNSLFLYRYSI